MSKQTRVGQVEVRRESETGFISIVFPLGVIDETEALRARALSTALIRDCWRQGESAFLICDNRRVTGTSAEARRVFADNDREEIDREMYIAIFGGSFAVRAFGNMIMKALELVTKKVVATIEAEEPQARAWLTTQRESYFARRRAKT